MWWRTRHGRGPPARHHLLEQLPGPAEHPCRVPLAAAHTPGTAPFPRSGPNTYERSGEEPFKQSSQAQNPRSHTAPASLQRSRTLFKSAALWRFLAGADLGRVTKAAATNRALLSRAWAAAMAAGGAPDVTGSFITAPACGLFALTAYASGVLISQLSTSARSGTALAVQFRPGGPVPTHQRLG